MLETKGIGVAKDGTVRYRKVGGRCSGDMDTALGNCVLMVAMVYSLCKHLGIRHECIDNGDDITVFMEEADLPKFLSEVKVWFTKLGFDIKVESVGRTLEQVEFCQTRPVCRAGKYVMVRNIVSLTKDTVTLLDMAQTSKWWYAIGECGLNLTDGIPIFCEFYRWLMSVGDPSKVARHPLYRCGLTNLASGMQYKARPIEESTRRSFASAFGISVERQHLLEAEISQLGTPAPGKAGSYSVGELASLGNEYFTATDIGDSGQAAEAKTQSWAAEYAHGSDQC